MAKTRQHVPLRVPSGWTGEARALVLQLERLLDEIYALLGQDNGGGGGGTAGVSDVAWDSANKRITQEKEGTVSNVVAVSTLKTAMELEKGDVGLGNVENKSGATIRSEMTLAEVIAALGYTPPQQDTTYSSLPAESGGTALSLVTTGEKYAWNSVSPHVGGYTWGELNGL